MPHQPLSSRLSLAQAVVSANSKTKAKALGIEKGATAEEEGWGQGQPSVRVMGREVRVLRRWGYEWDDDLNNEPNTAKDDEGGNVEAGKEEEAEGGDSQATIPHEPASSKEAEPPLWGLDPSALRSSHTPLPLPSPTTANLPIFPPAPARAYLLKSFTSPPSPSPAKNPSPAKKPSPAAAAAEKEHNLAKLLKALELLFASWNVLERGELDRRAWGWYVAVRPEVEGGVGGWGQRGDVRLGEILGLRRGG